VTAAALLFCVAIGALATSGPALHQADRPRRIQLSLSHRGASATSQPFTRSAPAQQSAHSMTTED